MATDYITFDKNRYYQHLDMEQWCHDQLGKGKWIQEPFPKTWQGMDCNWTVHSMFGNTTFAFRRNDDYLLFLLRWS